MGSQGAGVAMGVLLAIAAVVVFWKAHKARLLVTGGMVGMLIFSFAAACAFVVYQPPGSAGITDKGISILALCAVLIPALPFATVPLSIRWYRHR